MVTQSTVRRRRGAADTASTTSTTTEVPTSSTANSATSPSMKTIPELLDEESRALKNFLALVATVIMFFMFMIVGTTLPPPGRVYAVMIDAGSTGTRAQVFTFRKDPDAPSLLLEDTKVFKENKSLAALATGIDKPGPFFKSLLEKVKKAVPGMRRRKRTPIALHATAGLRLLGADASERALQHARDILNASEFLFQPEWVSILDEKDEAAHAWTTVNYLNGGLHSDRKTDLVGALDLGGASMQIVYLKNNDKATRVDDEKEEDTADDEHYERPEKTSTELDTKLEVMGREYILHTTSYLGLGLFDFAKRLYTLFESEGVLEVGNPCFRKDKVFERKELIFGVPGSEEKKIVTMTGDGDFERCVASAEIAIGTFSDLFDKKKKLPKGMPFYAFAYFYDRIVGSGLSSTPSKRDLEFKGKDLCETPAEKFGGEDRDEACTEFSYIYALLKIFTDDFSDKGAAIRFKQFIDGHMLGWALGATLETIQPVMHKQLSLDHEPLLM